MEHSHEHHHEHHSHEHHHHEMTIIVNTREKRWDKKEITYEEVVKLAYEHPDTDEKTVYTVNYRHGEHSKPSGSLTKGERVEVKEHMIFNVVRTNKS